MLCLRALAQAAEDEVRQGAELAAPEAGDGEFREGGQVEGSDALGQLYAGSGDADTGTEALGDVFVDEPSESTSIRAGQRMPVFSNPFMKSRAIAACSGGRTSGRVSAMAARPFLAP